MRRNSKRYGVPPGLYIFVGLGDYWFMGLVFRLGVVVISIFVGSMGWAADDISRQEARDIIYAKGLQGYCDVVQMNYPCMPREQCTEIWTYTFSKCEADWLLPERVSIKTFEIYLKGLQKSKCHVKVMADETKRLYPQRCSKLAAARAEELPPSLDVSRTNSDGKVTKTSLSQKFYDEASAHQCSLDGTSWRSCAALSAETCKSKLKQSVDECFKESVLPNTMTAKQAEAILRTEETKIKSCMQNRFKKKSASSWKCS